MSLPSHIMNIIRAIDIYDNTIPDDLEKILNLNDRKDLSEKYLNCLIQIDKKHLPDIIRAKRFEKDYYNEKNLKSGGVMTLELYNDFKKNVLQPLLDYYEFEKELVYDKNKKIIKIISI